MEVAEVDAPEQKKVRRSLLGNPQVNSFFSSWALVCHFATSLRLVLHQTYVSYVATDIIFFEYSQLYESLNSLSCTLAPFMLCVHYRKVNKHA